MSAVSTQGADLGSTDLALLLPRSHSTPCSLHFLGPSQVREHVNWIVDTQSEFVSQIPAQEDLGDIENIPLAFTFPLVGLPWGLIVLYHHAEFRVPLMESTRNWRVYWLVSQGSRLNVSAGSLLFKFIRVSWSRDKNWVSREYDCESRILRTSLEDPPKSLRLAGHKRTLEASLLSKYTCLAFPPSGLFGGWNLADRAS